MAAPSEALQVGCSASTFKQKRKQHPEREKEQDLIGRELLDLFGGYFEEPVNSPDCSPLRLGMLGLGLASGADDKLDEVGSWEPVIKLWQMSRHFHKSTKDMES